MLNRIIRSISKHPFWIGLVLLLAYYWIISPPGLVPGYVEDFCWEKSRWVMLDNLKEFGRPTFTTQRYMAPDGMGVPFFSWSIERDWLGAYAWALNPEFPFLWFYVLVSFLISYVGAGLILKKIGLSPNVAWLLATAAILLHIPRHFKIWHHHEYLLLHWWTLTVFLDVLIWWRAVRERRWSWNLELWRSFVLLGMMGGPGYYWGPSILLWGVVRISLAYLFLHRGLKLKIEGNFRNAILPLTLSVLWAVILVMWFPPLIAEMKKLGNVFQDVGWFVHPKFVVWPLWLSSLIEGLNRLLGRGVGSLTHSLVDGHISFMEPETVVTLGWAIWIPLLMALKALQWKRFRYVVPFFILFIIAHIYFLWGGFHPIQTTLRWVVPTMEYFRVSCRFAIFLPALVGAMIALSWPEWTEWLQRRPFKRKTLIAFGIIACLEWSWLLYPVNMMQPMDPSTENLLKGIQSAEGSAVLDMPFCMAGGNGVCTENYCPNYPLSTVGQCFAGLHGKNVFGLYQARLVESQCRAYNHAPYMSWFSAWKHQRCLNPQEWTEFCEYLSKADLAAILIYPDIWTGARDPQCALEIEKHLGAPLAKGKFAFRGSRGAPNTETMDVLRFGGKCVSK